MQFIHGKSSTLIYMPLETFQKHGPRVWKISWYKCKYCSNMHHSNTCTLSKTEIFSKWPRIFQMTKILIWATAAEGLHSRHPSMKHHSTTQDKNCNYLVQVSGPILHVDLTVSAVQQVYSLCLNINFSNN